MKLRYVLEIFAIVILINFASASFEIGNSSNLIETQYGPSDFVRGWINISLENEPADSIFESSFGDSINLIDLLKENNEVEYVCSIINCEKDYASDNEAFEKTFSMDKGESKVIGFKFDEELIAINSVSFTIESSAMASCSNQIEIDFLEDGSIDFGNYKTSEVSCPLLKDYGCFDDEATASEYSIGKFPSKHCQRVSLSESPGFNLGVYVKKNDDNRDLIMSLYDLYGESISGASCTIPSTDLQNAGSEVSCDIDYLVTESKDYYVCVYSEEEGNSKLVGYSLENGCGFYGTGIQPEIGSFRIFAEGKQFGAVDTIQISNALKDGNTLSGEVSDYIASRYGNLDCSSKNCFVPIKLISNYNEQDITISNLIVEYETILGSSSNNKLYDLTKIPAKINAGFQKIYLDKGNFSLPSEYGNETFELKLNGKDIFSENIIIQNIPIIKSITPETTASSYPTVFEVSVSSVNNISKYSWNFGDGNELITEINKAEHTYGAIGEYELTISVTDSKQRTSHRTFIISVSSPKEMINEILEKMERDLNKINNQIDKFPGFYQTQLKSILNLDEIKEELKQAKKEYLGATSEEDYNRLIGDLIVLKVPESIAITESAKSISFYPKESLINLDILKNIGGGDYKYSEEDDYIDAIFLWNQENLNTKIDFDRISAKYGQSWEEILGIFKFKISEKHKLNNDPYLILKKIDGLKFKENYLESEKDGYIYIDLKNSENVITFSTTENFDFTNLPLFISPGLNRLVLSPEFTPSDKKNSKWWLFVFIIFLLFLIGIVLYIILQQWYKRRYETYLFKNMNNLYNLVNYIESARKKGLKNEEIKRKLKKAKWSSEQINYAIKKHSGKRTGMFEIPIDKLLNKFRKKKNLYSPPKQRIMVHRVKRR